MAPTSRVPPAALFERPLGPVAASGWAAAYLVLLVLTIFAVRSLRPGSEYDGVSLALLELATALAVVLLIARVHAPQASLRELLGASPVGFAPCVVACLMGAAAALPLGAMDALITARFPSTDAYALDAAHAIRSLGRAHRLVSVVVGTLLSPFAPELLFRGVMATGVLRASGRRVALVATTLTFALVYGAGDYHFLPVHLLLGLLLAHARLSSASVLAALGAHLAYRGVGLFDTWRQLGTLDPVAALEVTPSWTHFYPPAILVGGTAATLVLAYLLVRVTAGAGSDRGGNVEGGPASADSRDSAPPRASRPPSEGGRSGTGRNRPRSGDDDGAGGDT